MRISFTMEFDVQRGGQREPEYESEVYTHEELAAKAAPIGFQPNPAEGD